MTRPAVSALIDTYNHERCIEQAIVSVLQQDIPARDLEIIVVDDGSTDHTPDIVRKFEPRVRLIRKNNGGQASAFNLGIAEATGDIVTFLDGDDWWARRKIKTVLEAFDKNPGIAAVGHGYFEVPGDSPPTEMFVSTRPLRLDLSSPEAARIANLGRMLLGTSRLAVRRSILERIMPIPDRLVYAADTPIFTLALALGGALILDQPLCYYRLHSPDVPDSGDSLRDSHHKFVRMRDHELNTFLVTSLSEQLVSLGVKPEIVSAFFEADRLALKRFQLQRDGGGRLQAFRTETLALRSEYQSTTVGYKLFKGLIGSLALLLPPQHFYNLRDWYSHRTGIHRLRNVFGHAEPIIPQSLFQRRRLTPEEK